MNLLRTIRAYHIVFAVSLLTLAILAGWWFIWHYSQVKTVHQDTLDRLDLKARILALEFGQVDLPRGFSLPADSPFQVVYLEGSVTPKGHHRLGPRNPNYALTLRPDESRNLEERLHRRMVMVVGEGSLLMFLVFVCVLMLYRLLLSERRLRQEMELFFHAVSHELKTPVAGVRALLETLLNRQVKTEELERYAKLGLRETDRLQGLVENVLLANRIDRQLFSAQTRPVNLNEHLESFVRRHRLIFANQPLEFDAVDPSCVALADPELLRHVVGNLVDNAFKYSPPQSPVSLRLRREGNLCIIEVEDRGIGFDPDQAARLFGKFERGSGEDVRRREGSGLGLFIARELVRAMGGRIRGESPGKDKGSCFRIELKQAT